MLKKYSESEIKALIRKHCCNCGGGSDPIFGEGAPDPDATGKDGQLYFDTDNGTLYEYVDDAWVFRMTLGGGGGGGAVNSVNAKVGDVTLLTDDISDAAQTNKYTTAAEKTKLSAITGTNTGDNATNSQYSGLAASKADINSPTFTGTVGGIDQTMVGLGNVDNTSDANKPVSTLQQAALNLKAPIANPTFTGTVGGINKTMVGLGNVDNTADSAKPVSTAQQSALNLKANIANPTFTGTVSGIDKTMVGLPNVDNTTDANKPVSSATQTALNLKANLASPALTGTPTVPTATPGTNNTQAASTAFVLANAGSGTVTSVNGEAGPAVVLTTDDLSDSGQANKFVTAGDLTKLGGISGTNTGDNAVNSNYSGLAASKENTITGTTSADYWSGAKTFLDFFTSVRAATLTGVSFVTATAIVAADTVLVALGKLQKQITDNIASIALKADLASPTFTGVPVAPTAAANTNTTQLATTAFVTTADNLKANLASPTFTGTPTLPTGTIGVTQAAGDNTTKLATTAHVLAERTNTATLTNKTISGANNTITNIAQSSVTSLATDLAGKQPIDSDLTAIAALAATSDNFIQSKFSAWASRTPAQVTADLSVMVGDSGSGGTKGLVPAPGTGDAASLKFLSAYGDYRVTPGAAPVVNTQASTSSLTPATATASNYYITALAANITINNPTMNIGDRIIIYIKDNSTARTITWGSDYYSFVGNDKPITTVSGKWMNIIIDKVALNTIFVTNLIQS